MSIGYCNICGTHHELSTSGGCPSSPARSTVGDPIFLSALDPIADLRDDRRFQAALALYPKALEEADTYIFAAFDAVNQAEKLLAEFYGEVDEE